MKKILLTCALLLSACVTTQPSPVYTNYVKLLSAELKISGVSLAINPCVFIDGLRSKKVNTTLSKNLGAKIKPIIINELNQNSVQVNTHYTPSACSHLHDFITEYAFKNENNTLATIDQLNIDTKDTKVHDTYKKLLRLLKATRNIKIQRDEHGAIKHIGSRKIDIHEADLLLLRQHFNSKHLLIVTNFKNKKSTTKTVLEGLLSSNNYYRQQDKSDALSALLINLNTGHFQWQNHISFNSPAIETLAMKMQSKIYGDILSQHINTLLKPLIEPI